MQGTGELDYEIYLNTKALLSCQKDFTALCNGDELQFQIVHQVEELWMKVIAYTLLAIDDYLQQENTNRVITLFRRVHMIQRLMTEQLGLLETMSPREYQEIRLQLGHGSGQESPGFRVLLKMYSPIWQSFKEHYLDKKGLTVEMVYNSSYNHSDAYVVAESLAEYDELFQKFRYHHLQLIHRSIGLGSQVTEGPRGRAAGEWSESSVLSGAMGCPQQDDGRVGKPIWRGSRFDRLAGGPVLGGNQVDTRHKG